MNNTEIRVMMDGQLVHIIHNPVAPPAQLTFLSIPNPSDPTGTKMMEVFIAKITTQYPKKFDVNPVTTYLCECELSDHK
jgi:hypothetical protein